MNLYKTVTHGERPIWTNGYNLYTFSWRGMIHNSFVSFWQEDYKIFILSLSYIDLCKNQVTTQVTKLRQNWRAKKLTGRYLVCRIVYGR